MSRFEPSPYSCPRCRSHSYQVPLFHQIVGGVGLHGCGACGGAFLAPTCARRLAQALPEEAIRLTARAAGAARYRADTSPPLNCPVCFAPMQRVNAARAGVDLDVCSEHGTFYDREEIERVAAAIRGSGSGWAGAAATAAVGGAVGGAVAAQLSTTSPAADRTLDAAGNVAEAAGGFALEVGGEVLLDGLFAMLGSIFD